MKSESVKSSISRCASSFIVGDPGTPTRSVAREGPNAPRRSFGPSRRRALLAFVPIHEVRVREVVHLALRLFS
jgi:hypothetical protein